MELSDEEVEKVGEVRDLVDDLIDIAEERDDTGFNKANLVLLYEQLDALHQGLAMAVAQAGGLEQAFDQED